MKIASDRKEKVIKKKNSKKTKKLKKKILSSNMTVKSDEPAIKKNFTSIPTLSVLNRFVKKNT